jgi:hypothetical protein
MQYIIHGYIICLLVQLFIHQHGKSVDLENLIRRFRFIQNHRQGRPSSPTRLQKDPNGRNFLILEILCQNLFSLGRYVDHRVLLSRDCHRPLCNHNWKLCQARLEHEGKSTIGAWMTAGGTGWKPVPKERSAFAATHWAPGCAFSKAAASCVRSFKAGIFVYI